MIMNPRAIRAEERFVFPLRFSLRNPTSLWFCVKSSIEAHA